MLYQQVKRRLDKYLLKVIPTHLYEKNISRRVNGSMTADEANNILIKHRENRATSSISKMANIGSGGG